MGGNQLRIQVLGEGGGIGDLLRRLNVVCSIKTALPAAKVWLFVQDKLIEWAQLSRTADTLAVVASQSRRGINQLPDPAKYPYLNTGAPFDATVDLYDPACAYEYAATGHITQGREEIWRAAATAVLGCPLTPQLDQLFIMPPAGVLAASQLRVRLGCQPSFLVGIHPLSYWRSRCVCFEQVCELVKALQAMGAQCMLFHHEADPVAAWAKELNTVSIIGEKPTMLAALLRLCDVMIATDSSLFHLAGMLGVPTIGMFAQTDGELMSQEYKSCQWVTAGLAEREGLGCQFPCYWRTAYGFNHPVCERGCRALHRISPKVVVDTAIKFILERKGVHLSPRERASRMFSSSYSQA
jgi:hypothetical protein